MLNAEIMNNAIGVHGLWKQRLRLAIMSGKSEFSVEQVRVDNLCEFGKWLYTVSAQEKNGEQFSIVQNLHASFHREAARILDLALNGKSAEATNAMADTGLFAVTSLKLTSEMMKWKRSLG